MNALATLIGLLAISPQMEADVVGQEAPRDNPVFVQQAEDARPDRDEKVFHPAKHEDLQVRNDDRRQQAVAPQLPAEKSDAELDQLSTERGGPSMMASQLTREEGRRALAQLTRADRVVLTKAVEGTDICDSEPTVPAIIELCLQRLENRSEEFATEEANRLSPEERLLGEGLDGDRVASLESAISRLARGRTSFESDEDQAVASVALSQGALAPASEAPAEANESDLSLETQTLINAIVEQLGSQGGGGG